jgi:DNA repair exonuclease SbcCD ATPase subunit
MFERRRQEVADRYAEPLRAKVAEYVDALYGPGSRIAVTIEGGSLKQLQVARPTVGGTTFDFGELSGGTREQVATACRLAMAEILVSGTDTPETDRCLPIVLDDAFTNSDPERIRACRSSSSPANRLSTDCSVLRRSSSRVPRWPSKWRPSHCQGPVSRVTGMPI